MKAYFLTDTEGYEVASPGVAVFGHAQIDEAVELILKLTPAELRIMAATLAQRNAALADKLADALIDGVYDVLRSTSSKNA